MNKIGGLALSAKVAVAVITCIWINNLAFNIPMFIWADVYSGWGGGLGCTGTGSGSYVLASRIINFYLPLVIMWACYIGIIYKLYRSMNKAIILFTTCALILL